MFHKQPDHTCLTRYNQRNQEQQRLEAEEAEEEVKKNSATVLIQHLVDFNRLSSLVHKKTKAIEGEFLGSTFCFKFALGLGKHTCTSTLKHTNKAWASIYLDPLRKLP